MEAGPSRHPDALPPDDVPEPVNEADGAGPDDEPEAEPLDDDALAAIYDKALEAATSGVEREAELGTIIVRLVDEFRVMHTQVASQAETIANLTTQQDFLVARAIADKERWDAERETFERTTEALVLHGKKNGGHTHRVDDLEAAFEHAKQENNRLAERLEAEQARNWVLTDQYNLLKPILLMQPQTLLQSHQHIAQRLMLAAQEAQRPPPAVPNANGNGQSKKRKTSEGPPGMPVYVPQPQPPPHVLQSPSRGGPGPVPALQPAFQQPPSTPSQPTSSSTDDGTPMQPGTAKQKNKYMGPLLADAKTEYILQVARREGAKRGDMFARHVSKQWESLLNPHTGGAVQGHVFMPIPGSHPPPAQYGGMGMGMGMGFGGQQHQHQHQYMPQHGQWGPPRWIQAPAHQRMPAAPPPAPAPSKPEEKEKEKEKSLFTRAPLPTTPRTTRPAGPGASGSASVTRTPFDELVAAAAGAAQDSESPTSRATKRRRVDPPAERTPRANGNAAASGLDLLVQASGAARSPRRDLDSEEEEEREVESEDDPFGPNPPLEDDEEEDGGGEEGEPPPPEELGRGMRNRGKKSVVARNNGPTTGTGMTPARIRRMGKGETVWHRRGKVLGTSAPAP
ncbi:hypothetical protein EXIGLDRAFT_838683 [Exidia glandulosa HHB12029]|uniref:Uncharacterized protein n=1 Tax=Exidia glandulosa HHB12029 TaxID=1314781 RepID=A0A165FLX1_EXIGL|nr:hypothetical protein EXIGLDRAFT_838683 [Exidia glandulosa HHB12029]